MLNSNQKDALFLERLLSFNQDTPNFKCCFFLDREGEISNHLTVGEWIHKARLMAAQMKKKGLKPGDRVLLALPTSEDLLIAFIALWWIGGVPVPSPELTPNVKRASIFERLSNIIKDCSPVACIMEISGKETALAGPVPPGIEFWTPQDLLQECSIQVPTSLKPREEDIAFIQYTSGSTGAPKGVVITQGCLRGNIHAMEGAAKMCPEDRLLTWMPLYHDMGLIGGIFFPLYYRATCYLMSTLSFLANPGVWLKSLSQHRITISTAPNFAYSLCARRIKPENIPGLDLSSWRLAFNGAEPISVKTLRAFEAAFSPYGFSKTTFYPVYGMAEATLGISFPGLNETYEVDYIRRRDLIERSRATLASSSESDVVPIVCVGSCLPGHKIEIRRPDSQDILPDREIGEICFSGPSISPGYFHELQSSGFSHSRQELRTGDLGYLSQGRLYVVDRLKDLIKVAGSSYFPTDLESQIHNLPGIRANRVVALEVPDLEKGTSSLIVVAEVEGEVDFAPLQEKIRSTLYSTHGLTPKDILLTEKRAIPLTSSGKLMRRKCRDLYLQGELKMLD